jgi:hypothetical protein
MKFALKNSLPPSSLVHEQSIKEYIKNPDSTKGFNR